MANLRYDHPFDTLVRLQEDLARNLTPRGPIARENVSARIWSPPVDVYEDQEKIVILTDLPGIKQENIDIEMNDDILTICGERTFEDEARRENYVRVERQYGAFQRSFTIGVPVEIEKVKATYRNGILELTIPKSEAVRPKKVQVSVE